jgi:uncharacterized iron-regulated protein
MSRFGARTIPIIAGLGLLGFLMYFMADGRETDAVSPHLDQRVLRLSDHSVVTLAQVLEDIKDVPVIIVGELHDTAPHHWMQLRVIQGLDEADATVAVGLEMFEAQQQYQLDRWLRGELSEKEFIPIYLRNWNYDWNLYADIFHYCRNNQIPMIGLNVPREVTGRIAQSGFSALDEGLLQELPPVSCNVDKDYEEFIRRALESAHGHGTGFQHFCEAQLVWDTVMAWHALKFLERNRDHHVVILAGSGHAWKRGIAEQIRRQSDLLYRVILPENPRLDRNHATTEDTDYLWLDLPAETEE